MKRPILDINGNPTGAELELPDDTPEEVWQQRLNEYKFQTPDYDAIRRRGDIEKRQDWSRDLMQRFKEKNMNAGINIMQALWLQHRMRSLDVLFNGISMRVDMLNLAVSGDVEVACVALQYATVDDMSQPYHWFSEDNRTWLVTEMKKFLGWS